MRNLIRRLPVFLSSISVTAAVVPSPLTAASVMLTPAADTSIMEASPGNNMGAVPSMAVGVTGSHGNARGLIKFDLAGGLPAGAVISSATLRLTVVRQPFLVDPATFGLHRLLVPWGEGDKESPGGALTSLGSAATSGEATWAARLSPLTLWQSAGGGSGDDYAEEVSASAEVGSFVSFSSTPIMVADLQSWLTDPGANYGWLIRDVSEDDTSQTARRLGSRENAEAIPQLTIEYTPPTASEPPRLTDLALDTGNLCFKFQAKAGKTYSVERRTDIATGSWASFQTIPSGSAQVVTICDTVGTEPKFYRVAEQ